MLRLLEDRQGGGGLDEPAGVHDGHPVAEFDHERHVVRDEQDREPELALQILDLGHDLLLHDDVERRGGLVHDQQRGTQRRRHRDDDALPHAPGELVRICAQAIVRDADEVKQLVAAAQGLLLGEPLVGRIDVGDLVADRHDGVERVHRALEHHRHLPPAERTQFVRAQREHVCAAEPDRSTRDDRRVAQQPQDGVRDRRLAAAGLSGQAEHLALTDGEAHAVDGAHRTGIRHVFHREVGDFEQGSTHRASSFVVPVAVTGRRRGRRRRGLVVSSTP